jgi:hypothetical protein
MNWVMFVFGIRPILAVQRKRGHGLLFCCLMQEIGEGCEKDFLEGPRRKEYMIDFVYISCWKYELWKVCCSRKGV